MSRSYSVDYFELYIANIAVKFLFDFQERLLEANKTLFSQQNCCTVHRDNVTSHVT